MWAEAGAGVGVLGLMITTLFRFQHSRMNKQHSRMDEMEVSHRKDLYQPNGQTNYIPRSEYKADQETFCNKIDEVKSLIISMDEKREDAKDNYHLWQTEVAERLGGIEAKLPSSR